MRGSDVACRSAASGARSIAAFATSADTRQRNARPTHAAETRVDRPSVNGCLQRSSPCRRARPEIVVAPRADVTTTALHPRIGAESRTPRRTIARRRDRCSLCGRLSSAPRSVIRRPSNCVCWYRVIPATGCDRRCECTWCANHHRQDCRVMSSPLTSRADRCRLSIRGGPRCRTMTPAVGTLLALR